MRILIWLALVLLAAANFLPLVSGRTWPIDLATLFRPQIVLVAVVLLLLALALRRWTQAAVAALIAIVGAYATLDLPQAPTGAAASGNLRLASFNLGAHERDIGPEIDWLLQGRFDVVAIYEVTPGRAAQLPRLGARFPHSIVEPRDSSFGMALFSIHPLRAGQVFQPADQGASAIRALVDTPQGAVEILALHPPAPLSADRAERRNRYLDQVAQLPPLAAHRIALGDFNAAPWTGVLRDFTRTTGFAFVTRIPPTTFHTRAFFPFTIPIDHALVAGGIAAIEYGRGPHVGSDHWPVVLTVAVPVGERR